MKNRQNRARRHHYRPQLQLKHFSSDGLIWQYARDADLEPRRIPPRDAGVESFLYAPEAGPDPKTDEVEVWLASEIDSPADKPLRKLLEGEALNPNERARMARLIALQDMRTPYARDFLMGLAQEQLDADMAPYLADPERVPNDLLERTGEDYTIEEIEEVAANGKLVLEKPFWLEFMARHVDGSSRKLYEKGWWRIEAPEGTDFVTSDTGIVKYRRRDFTDPVEGRIGWWNSGFYWLVPLSPKLALGLGPGLPAARLEATAERITEFNRLMVQQARRFVYSRDREDWIHEALTAPVGGV